MTDCIEDVVRAVPTTEVATVFATALSESSPNQPPTVK